MDNRTLGMIPDLRPPEGVPETPQGFARLPTKSELLTSLKAWIANYPNWLSASAVQEFTIDEEERQELIGIYKKVIDQSEEAPGFNKDETFTLEISDDLDHYHNAIYFHEPTGLRVGTTYDLGVIPARTKVPRPATMQAFKHVWVTVDDCGEASPLYVERLEDVPRLISVLEEIHHKDEISIVISEEFLKKSILNL